MHVSNPAALLALELGAEYLVTFEKAAPAKLEDGHAFRARADHPEWDDCGECGVARALHEEPRRSELLAQARGSS